MVVGYWGLDQRVEFKDPKQPPSKRRLTEAEAETFKTWGGRKPVILETFTDVDVMLEAMRKDARTLAKEKY